MIGDIHPRFPLLSVARVDENGTPTSWRTKGPYWSLDDPRIMLIRDQAGRVLKRHPNYTDAFVFPTLETVFHKPLDSFTHHSYVTKLRLRLDG